MSNSHNDIAWLYNYDMEYLATFQQLLAVVKII